MSYNNQYSFAMPTAWHWKTALGYRRFLNLACLTFSKERFKDKIH